MPNDLTPPSAADIAALRAPALRLLEASRQDDQAARSKAAGEVMAALGAWLSAPQLLWMLGAAESAAAKDDLARQVLAGQGIKLAEASASRDYWQDAAETWRKRAEKAEADARRYQWVKPILSGDNDGLADERTFLIGRGLVFSRSLDETIDAAIASQPAAEAEGDTNAR